MLTQYQAQNAYERDINVTNPQDQPKDSISCISWSPHGPNPCFATSGWDSKIRIYNMDQDSKVLKQKSCFDAESPCLSVNWHQDEVKLFAGCTDGAVKSFDGVTGDSSLIGHHEGPVKSVYWISQGNTLLTLSFDKTLRFWDPRQAKHVAGFQLDEKILCSDLLYPYLAIGFNGEKALLMNLSDIQRVMDRRNEPYTYADPKLGRECQLTSVKLYVSGRELGVGFGGNDGRCRISKLTNPEPSLSHFYKAIGFKAHKGEEKQNERTLYPVNCMGFHPHMKGEFLYTAGGDGRMRFWDLAKKTRTSELDFKEIPVTRAELDPSGKYLAYSLGYDWARGIQGHMTQQSKVCVHVMEERELKQDKFALELPIFDE